MPINTTTYDMFSLFYFNFNPDCLIIIIHNIEIISFKNTEVIFYINGNPSTGGFRSSGKWKPVSIHVDINIKIRVPPFGMFHFYLLGQCLNYFKVELMFKSIYISMKYVKRILIIQLMSRVITFLVYVRV